MSNMSGSAVLKSAQGGAGAGAAQTSVGARGSWRCHLASTRRSFPGRARSSSLSELPTDLPNRRGPPAVRPPAVDLRSCDLRPWTSCVRPGFCCPTRWKVARNATTPASEGQSLAPDSNPVRDRPRRAHSRSGQRGSPWPLPGCHGCPRRTVPATNGARGARWAGCPVSAGRATRPGPGAGPGRAEPGRRANPVRPGNPFRRDRRPGRWFRRPRRRSRCSGRRPGR